jgi:endonuclease/exonuclease/phosphatase family metal-dependent hydrolase
MNLHDWYARIVDGDFNIRPGQNPGVRPDWYPGYHEGDETWHYAGADRRTTKEGHPTYPPGVKIDYMFADKFWVNPASGSADIRCSTGSDHCLYLATFYFA